MSTKSTCWHWPDHVIGKRESRRLREEHNKLANEHAELADALCRALPFLTDVLDDPERLADFKPGFVSEQVRHIRALIAKSEGTT